MIDFTNDAQSATPEDLQKVSELADKAAILKTRINAGEMLLKDLNKQLSDIEQVELPELMDSFGLKKFLTNTGISVDINSFVKGGMPTATAIAKASGEAKEKLQERLHTCLAFIKANGGESIIKSKAEIDIGKDPKMKEALEDALDNLKADYLMSDAVHHSTLTAWIKEKMANNVTIPVEPFALYTGKKAIIKLPK